MERRVVSGTKGFTFRQNYDKSLPQFPKEKWQGEIAALQKQQADAVDARATRAKDREVAAIAACEAENKAAVAQYEEKIGELELNAIMHGVEQAGVVPQEEPPVPQDCSAKEIPAEPEEEKTNFDTEQKKMQEDEKKLRENPPADSYLGRWELGLML